MAQHYADVHYQTALAALAGAILLVPRIGKFGHGGCANAPSSGSGFHVGIASPAARIDSKVARTAPQPPPARTQAAACASWSACSDGRGRRVG